jgi:hypothetical protein
LINRQPKSERPAQVTLLPKKAIFCRSVGILVAWKREKQPGPELLKRSISLIFFHALPEEKDYAPEFRHSVGHAGVYCEVPLPNVGSVNSLG